MPLDPLPWHGSCCNEAPLSKTVQPVQSLRTLTKILHPLNLKSLLQYFRCLCSRLHKATGDAGYLREAEAFYERSRTTEKFTNPNPDRFSYENVIPALHLLLYKVRAAELGWTTARSAISAWQSLGVTSGLTQASEA